MAKLQDVALSAGVSTATVSLVLAGKDEGRVSRKTSEKVKATAKELGYVGNAAASSLRTRTTNTIGFLSDYIATTPYAVEMIESANRVAGDNDQLLLLVNTEGSKKAEQFAVEEFLRRGVTGTVIAAMFHREVQVSPKLGQDVVILDGYSKDPTIPAVVPDERQGILDVMQLLLDRGHTRIAYLGERDREGAAATLRRDAYREAMYAASLRIDKGWEIECEGKHKDAVSAARTLIESAKPTAICCYNDFRAHAVYRAARQLGLNIPEDLSVVGFDNQELIAPLLMPPLTTVALPHSAMAQWAVSALLDEEADSDYSHYPLRFRCPVVERDSVAEPKG